MGMFDDITCEYPLPVPEAQHYNFQTKDLECMMGKYTITAEGRLVLHAWKYEEVPTDKRAYPDAKPGSMQALVGIIRKVEGSEQLIDQNWEGILDFYGGPTTGELMAINMQTGEDALHPGPRPHCYEFEARFVGGTVQEIIELPGW